MNPTETPSGVPTAAPSHTPTTAFPSTVPSDRPTQTPSIHPTLTPQTLNEVLTCISAIDESSLGASTIENDWTAFRADYPDRHFCLLGVEADCCGNVLHDPPAFLAELADPAGKVIRHHDVPRDNGSQASATDWYAMCELDSLKAQGATKVAYFVDDSGSMSVASVQASIDLLHQRLAAEGIELVMGTSNTNENWVSPFLLDL